MLLPTLHTPWAYTSFSPPQRNFKMEWMRDVSCYWMFEILFREGKKCGHQFCDSRKSAGKGWRRIGKMNPKEVTHFYYCHLFLWSSWHCNIISFSCFPSSFLSRIWPSFLIWFQIRTAKVCWAAAMSPFQRALHVFLTLKTSLSDSRIISFL